MARKLAAARTFFRYQQRMGRTENNVAAQVRNPKQEQRHPRVLNVDQAFAVLDTPDALAVSGSPRIPPATCDALAARDHALAELLYGSGLRISEALGLDVTDLRLKEGVARVFGKGARERMSPLSDTSVTALRAWLEQRGTLAPEHEKALFVGARGGRLEGCAVTRAWSPSLPTPCAIRSRPTCWMPVPICAVCRSCWGTSV